MPMPDHARSNAAESGGAPPQIVDLLIVGGGINGAGIARDAAGRGRSVMLCEMGDLAQGTSSRSSGLIHGGLRYLEYGEFRLVREALREREILLGIAPHLVRPMRFVLPHVAHMRPAWMLRAGLFLYDHLARRERLPGSAAVSLDRVPEGAAVQAQIHRGFVYSDCRTDDARLVIANALAARQLGAHILTRVELVRAERSGQKLWQVQLHDLRSGAVWNQLARALINAAGPWVDTVSSRVAGVRPRRRVVLVKGSHIVVAKFWEGEHAFILQNVDRRVVFATPYEGRFALIGTTDQPYVDAPERVAISEAEIDYLCAAVNRQLRCELGPADVRHKFSGVRCLVDDERDDPSAVTRDYLIDIDSGGEDRADGLQGQAPYITILGGKITTYRRLAEQVLDSLRPAFACARVAWTANQPLPGGDLAGDLLAAESQFLREVAFLPPAHARALFGRHGNGARTLLSGIHDRAGLGRHFGAGLYECEAIHLTQNEWALTAEDLLWRRTKCGLQFTPEELRDLEDWLARQHLGAQAK
jgi:glycerol-3-phosphate dehydrogenase